MINALLLALAIADILGNFIEKVNIHEYNI